jgi:hypothetical protein
MSENKEEKNTSIIGVFANPIMLYVKYSPAAAAFILLMAIIGPQPFIPIFCVAISLFSSSFAIGLMFRIATGQANMNEVRMELLAWNLATFLPLIFAARDIHAMLYEFYNLG